MTNISPVNLRILILQLLIAILTPISFVKLGHYLILPMSFMSDTPSAISLSQNQKQISFQTINWLKTIMNNLLFSVFYVQHILMAKLKYKINASNKWTNFPVYERLIYNIVSSILLILVIQYQQPQQLHLFTLPSLICYPLALIGTSLFVIANIQMQQSIVFPYKFQKLFSSRQVLVKQNNYEKIEQDGITIKGAYSLVRHPMQGGVMLLLTFGSPIFTLDKVIILTSIIIFIIVGVKMQEERLITKFKQYQSYMKIVTNRFIPYLI